MNQGALQSGFCLIRKYLSDLDEYLDIHFGVCVGDMIVAHILWADDLVLMAESISGMQDQLLFQKLIECQRNKNKMHGYRSQWESELKI